MDLVQLIKDNLRLSTSHFDDYEIIPIIDACKKDLHMLGIQWDDRDPLCIRALVLYAKANFGYDANSERFREAYQLLKSSMSVSGDYVSR